MKKINCPLQGALASVHFLLSSLTVWLLLLLAVPVTASAQQPPVVTSFSPTSGNVGAVVNISGLNFDPTPGNNIVYFGAVRAVVSAASTTNLAVTVPVSATYGPITETVNGLVAYSSAVFEPTFAGNGSSIGPSTFAARVDIPTPDQPISCAVGDLNGDGEVDVVTANYGDGSISIFQNLGAGEPLGTNSFGPAIDLPCVGGPLSVILADVDGDGKLDIVAADTGANQILIYRNLSAGGLLTSNSFAAPVALNVAPNTRFVRVAALTGDGRPDIVCASSVSNIVSIFKNIGTAGSLTTNSFAPRVDLTGVGSTYNLIVADLDGDGKPDLAVLDNTTALLSVFRNISTPGVITTNSFAPRVDLPALQSNQGLAAADLEGDGKLDLITGSAAGSTYLSVYHNQATPGSLTTSSFAPAVNFPMPGWVHDLAVGDLNGDGKPDLLSTEQSSDYLSVFQNTYGSGSFTNTSLGARVDFGVVNDPWGECVVDLDGDGRPDVVFVNQYGDNLSIYQNVTPFGGPPVITQQPTNQTVPVGNTATFAVTASGYLPLNYQWNFNSTNLLGATNATLTLTNVQPSQAGNYSVLVTNLYGSLLSSNALLTVLSPTNVPVIISFAPPLGQTGTVVSIKGLNFSPIASNNIVYFGAVRAVVSTASATNLTVAVPVGATYAPITETVNGLTAYADSSFLPTFPGSSPITSASLGPPINLPTGNGPGRVIVSDLDGDGKPDLVIGDSYSGTITIYQNIGTNGTLSAASFGPQIVLPGILGTYDNPYANTVADIDGDGRPDIIAIYADSDLVAIYRNLSSPGILTSNSFAAPVYLPAGNGMRCVAVQDLNGDGKPDIVTADSGDNTISIFQNQSTPGNIAFAPRVDLAAGNSPQGVAIGDLDGDGQPDLAVANANDGTISVFRNLGLGGTITTNSFAPPVVFPAPASDISVLIGDVDGDGKPDLVVEGASASDEMAVLRNTSTVGSITTNSFAPAVDFSLTSWGHTSALGDLNGDGKADIAVVSGIESVQDSLLSIFQNESTPGSFTTNSLGSPVGFATGSNPWGVTFGDLNGDGRPDVILVNQYGPSVSIYPNLTPFGGPPVITQQPTNQTVPVGNSAMFAVTAAGSLPLNYQWNFNGTNLLGATNAMLVLTNVQFNQSGNYSVLVTNLYGSLLSSNALLTVLSPANVPIIMSFTPPLGQTGTVVNITGLNFSPIASNNIVRFGAVRAVVSAANPTNLTVTVPVGATYAPITETVNGLTAYADSSFLSTFPGSGPVSSASLGPPINLPTGNGPGRVIVSDLDGDGKPDLVIANSYSGTITIYQNIGTNGTLSAASFGPQIVLPGILGTYEDPYTIAVADIDGDGRPDIIASYADSGFVAIYRNLSSPGVLTTNSFAAPVYLQGGDFMLGLAVQDLNGDGKPDIVTADAQDNAISIFQNQSTPGNIAFAPRVNLPAGHYPVAVAIGDLDGDGQPDLAVANSSDDTVSVYRNLGLGGTITTNSFTAQVVFPVPAFDISVVIGDVDGDGKADLVLVDSSASAGLAVLRNTSMVGSIATNSFAPAVAFTLSSSGHTSALGDLNGDGKPDIAVDDASLLSLFQNQSTPGGFTTNSLGNRVTFGTGSNPWGVTFGDLNGDGRPDVILVNQYGPSLSIYPNLTPFGRRPVINQQPASQTNFVGITAAFTVAATGSTTFSYQWTFDGTNLLTATNMSLTLTNLQFWQAGTYAVLVTNLYGATMSSNALLVVNPYLHFVWNPIPSPRFAGAPFAVTVQAENQANGLATDFTGTVVLVTTNGMPVNPAVSGNFSQGAWAGTVIIAQTGTNLMLEASDSYGENGMANPINVVSLPMLATTSSGGTLYISWPVNPSGFVLETSPNLSPGSWVPVSVPPIIIEDQYYLEPITITGANVFYRLRFTGP